MICTLAGKLLAITEPLPEAKHDAYAFKHHGLDQLLDSSTLTDKGLHWMMGIGYPSRRYKTRSTTSDVKAVNGFINSRRAVVEQVIAQVKTWRILHTGFRRPLGLYGRVFSAVWGLCFMLLEGLLNKPLSLFKCLSH